jgi:hypothetical protein
MTDACFQVFDISATKLLLCTDMEASKHLTMTPLQLQQTQTEYSPRDAKKFKHRIY